MKLLLATTNKSKVAELIEILGDQGFDLASLDQHAAEAVEETGTTFEENALTKARHFFAVSGQPTIADDSGIEIAALGGKPGVYSARYAATDAARIERVLREMSDVPTGRRQARFVSAAAFVSSGIERVFVGTADGEIMFEPRGSGGFGYDPIFYYPPLGQTFAELSRRTKSEVSHRGIAFKRLGEWIRSEFKAHQ